MTGIAAALDLAERGHKVTLYEARDHLGGLSDTYRWEDVTWDRFYHVILSTDELLVDLIRQLGLENELYWRETRSGFYGDGKLVSMSSIGDFIRFPFLSLWQKFRLGVGILSSTGITDADKLDRVYVREWLIRVFGRRVYEKIWDPLLRSKLGEARHQTSAAFIWATIKRLYGARSGEAKTEKMGHVHGGYRVVLAAVERELAARGVDVRTGEPVETIMSDGGGPSINTASGKGEFDSVLLTVPVGEIMRLTEPARSHLDDRHEYWSKLSSVQYLGVCCLMIVLNQGLSPYYVINLLDTSMPFTGIVEASNVAAPEDMRGKHIVYLPKYVTADDPIHRESDQAITGRFISALRRVFPELDDASILHTKLFRETYVQPLQEVNRLENHVEFATPIPGVYVANSAMLYNTTLNNNAAITLAGDAVAAMTSGETPAIDG